MGVIQQSINSAISSTGQAAGIAKGVKQLEKSNELAKINAEAEYLKGEDERNQELANLNKYKEQSKIEADKAQSIADQQAEDYEVLSGVFLPEDKEGQALVLESERRAKLAQANAEAKKQEKLNNYKYVRERKAFIEKQGALAKEKASLYGFNVENKKGGKK